MDSLLLLLLGYSEVRLCQIYGDRWRLCNKIQLKTSIQLHVLECKTKSKSQIFVEIHQRKNNNFKKARKILLMPYGPT